MSKHYVKIADGDSNVLLPNGGTYVADDIVALTEEEFVQLSDGSIDGDPVAEITMSDIFTPAAGVNMSWDGLVDVEGNELVFSVDFEKTTALVVGTGIEFGSFNAAFVCRPNRFGYTLGDVRTPDNILVGVYTTGQGAGADRAKLVFIPFTAHDSGAMDFEAYSVRFPLPLT